MKQKTISILENIYSHDKEYIEDMFRAMVKDAREYVVTGNSQVFYFLAEDKEVFAEIIEDIGKRLKNQRIVSEIELEKLVKSIRSSLFN